MKALIAHIILLMLPFCVLSQSKDTSTLPSVKVKTIKPVDNATSVVPVQQLNKENLGKLNSLSVADAVKYFSGVLVKDYGGIGGLKTISVRSLGANHTGVMYDGIMLSDAQGGQIDLGKLSLDNVESISLYNAQPTDIVTPARSFASASVLVLKSSSGLFNDNQNLKVKAGIKGGSFGFVNPSVALMYKVNKKLSVGVNGEYQYAKGNYSFKSYEVGGTTQKRKNSDVNTYRGEYDAHYAFSDSNHVHLKGYYYNSKRGLPGSIILYNDNSDEQLADELMFMQANWKKQITTKSSLNINAKYTSNNSEYVDNQFNNTEGRLENNFHQKEWYVSGAYAYKIASNLSVAYASDFFISKLTRTDKFVQNFANPLRRTWLNNITAQFRVNRLQIQGNILSTTINEKVQNGKAANKLQAYSPSIAFTVKPFINAPLIVRAFYKDIFRSPTFNDLYYTFIGNTELKPEYVKQYNVGFTWQKTTKAFIKNYAITVDGYYNNVKDKIIAVPKQNLFQWTMLNVGKVDIKGMDINANLHFKPIGQVNFSSIFSYTYQDALDITDPTSSYYKTQLPYTPKHSGAIHVAADYKAFSFSYNVLLSSYRYRLGEPTQDNLVKEWATNDISCSYRFKHRNTSIFKLTGEINNILNKQYEVIKYYPMPKLNYRIGLAWEL